MKVFVVTYRGDVRVYQKEASAKALFTSCYHRWIDRGRHLGVDSPQIAVLEGELHPHQYQFSQPPKLERLAEEQNRRRQRA